MPIYEFSCAACGERFEQLATAGTEAATCPACGTEAAARVLSAPAPSPRLVMTGKQDRRSQVKRGVDRATAKERFAERRKKARGQ